MQRFFLNQSTKNARKEIEVEKKSPANPSVLWDIPNVDDNEVFKHGMKFITLCCDYLRRQSGFTELFFCISLT